MLDAVGNQRDVQVYTVTEASTPPFSRVSKAAQQNLYPPRLPAETGEAEQLPGDPTLIHPSLRQYLVYQVK